MAADAPTRIPINTVKLEQTMWGKRNDNFLSFEDVVLRKYIKKQKKMSCLYLLSLKLSQLGRLLIEKPNQSKKILKFSSL